MLATDNQITDSRKKETAPAVVPEPAPIKAAPAKKFMEKPVANVAADFTNAKGEIPTPLTPSLAQPLIFLTPAQKTNEGQEAFYGDITIIRNGAAEEEKSGTTRSRSNPDQENESADGHGFGTSGYGQSDDVEVGSNFLQSQMQETNRYLSNLRNDAASCRARQDHYQARMDARRQYIEYAQTHESEWAEEQKRLTARVEGNKQELAKAEKAQTEAVEAYSAKVAQIYGPNGRNIFSGDGPDSVEIGDEKLRQEAWAKNRDSIEADYVSKGFTKEEFAAMERSINGQPSQPGDNIGAAADKARAAGLSGNLYVALNEKLKQNDPANPYLDTKDSKSVDTQKAVEISVKASTEFVAIQNENVYGKIQELAAKRDALAKAREDNDSDAKEKRKATETLTKIDKEVQTATTYKNWLTKNEGVKMTRAEFEKNVPESMRESVARDMAAQNIQTGDSSAQNSAKASRSIASAASSNIEAPLIRETFNAAAPPAVQGPPASAPAAPAPAVEVRKPAPGLGVASPTAGIS
ncbi:MAG: hypothetical protein JWO78_1823 [Micavibrio sp.]|nr:hypothetical protein [Micavibrio sp.]